jgi:hypothetical protein
MREIRGADRKKPLCYDPSRGVFITYDDIVSGREPIILPGSLSPEHQRLLVIRRQETGPEYTVGSISGYPMTRDDVIAAVRRNDDFGRAAVEAEISYLNDLLTEMGAEPGTSGKPV